MLTVDIVEERIGAFRIEQEFPMPLGLVDKTGHKITEGDAVYIEPFRDTYVVMQVFPKGSDLFLRVLESMVDGTSDALLYGQPMGKISFNDVLKKLEPVGIRIVMRDDDTVELSDHASLVVVGNQIDKIMMGVDQERLTRTWKEIDDPQQVASIVQSAEAKGSAAC